MLGFRLVFVVGLGLTVVGACSNDDGGNDGRGEFASLCGATCEKAAPLNCAQDPSDCAGACEAAVSQAGEACSSQYRAFLGCGENRPTTDFECNADGESVIKASVCSAEQKALMRCLFGSFPGARLSDCPFTNDGECDDDLCPAGTDTTDCAGAVPDGG